MLWAGDSVKPSALRDSPKAPRRVFFVGHDANKLDIRWRVAVSLFVFGRSACADDVEKGLSVLASNRRRYKSIRALVGSKAQANISPGLSVGVALGPDWLTVGWRIPARRFWTVENEWKATKQDDPSDDELGFVFHGVIPAQVRHLRGSVSKQTLLTTPWI